MCVDTYVTGAIVRDRLNELRAEAARARIVLGARRPVRVSVGRWLIRLGRWLTAPPRVQPSAT